MIYFMQSVDGGPIKIGHSKDVDARRLQLEWHYGCSLAVLATLPGGRKEEAEIHGHFSHLRLGRTEQFRPATDLMEFINRPLLVHPNPEAVEVMSSDRRFGVLVRLAGTLVANAKIVASMRGISMAEYLSERFGPIIEQDMEEEMKKRLKGKST